MSGTMPTGEKVVVRFAPSPTGLFHVGSYRTALFNYLFAKQSGGKFILRIEDTDRERSKKEYEENILASLTWLGLHHDEFYRQSERGEVYRRHLEKLLASDAAYQAEDGVIRFRNPKREVTFNDLIRGEVKMDPSDLGDFVIAKSLTEPLFHLAVVVDDFESGVTHIIRGEDHLANTPRHILLQAALGAPRPLYAHLPLVLAPDRSKLSKRHGAEPITVYRDRGYLPAAFVNCLALLGWHPNSEQEIFTLAELIADFDLSRIQKGGAIFDPVKLDWYNREHLKRLSDEEFAERAAAFWPAAAPGLLRRLAPELKQRVTTLSQVGEWGRAGEFAYLAEEPKPSRALLQTTEFLPAVIQRLSELEEENWQAEKIKQALWDFATEKGRARVLWPTRVALTGREKSPDPFTVAALLGKAETLRRLQNALGV